MSEFLQKIFHPPFFGKECCVRIYNQRQDGSFFERGSDGLFMVECALGDGADAHRADRDGTRVRVALRRGRGDFSGLGNGKSVQDEG